MNPPRRPRGEFRTTQREPPAAAVFGADWLARREPFDTAARDVAARSLQPASRLAAWRQRRETAAGERPWRIVDLACGTGANLRWLAPRLGGRQQWLVADHDPALLARWTTLPGARPGAGGRLHVAGPSFEAAVVRRRIDLAGALEALPWHAADLVTASALLDLVGADWLARLVHAAAAARVALLFALSVDGHDRWRPRDPADALVAALFAAHQRRDKGFGPALGATAAAALAHALRAAGYRVHRARSDWHVDGGDGAAGGALLVELIDGIAAAAIEQQPSSAAVVRAWRQRRLAGVAATTLRVGHVELLALPPG
ncbi:MAG: class I SAM-dependent methyltransferase [Rubrivivax sp.]